MFGFCSKRLKLLVPSCSISVDLVTRLHFLHKAPIFSRSYSPKLLLGSVLDKPQEQCHPFTVSFLVNSCGLSPERALSVCNKVRIDNPKGPESVLQLLKNHGFEDTHIAQLVQHFPVVLMADATKTLLPKLKFFSSIGLSGSDIARVLCGNPAMWQRDIDTTLRPCYDIIKSLLFGGKHIAAFFKQCRNLKIESIRKIPHNVSVLRGLGVPVPILSAYVAWQPHVFTSEHEKLNQTVKKVMSMGIQPSSATAFLKAVQVVNVMDSSKWARKMELYRKCGWTDTDFLVAFRKNPQFMKFADSTFSSKMDFIVNKIALVQPADLASNPTALTYSLKNWIIPRCSVIRVLLLRGLITREAFSFNSMMGQAKKDFLAKFLVPYREHVPELLSIYEGKMGLAELELVFEESCGVE